MPEQIKVLGDVLVVDDDPLLCAIAESHFKRRGAKNVQTASDGVQALGILDKAQKLPNFLLCDLNMPNMDGISLIKELRTLPSYKFTPLLMLTTESSSEKKQQGKAAGATGWIVKPFNPEQLLNTVKKVLG